MKKIFILTTTCLFASAQAQNLVPNSDFEDTANVVCGIYSSSDLAASVNYWYSPTAATPDIHSTTIAQSCWNYQPNSTYGGPIGLKGSQMPRSGNTFAGLFCYTIAGLNQREYIQSPLASPLVAGLMYYVEFYVSLADHIEKYTDKIGAYFSDLPLYTANDQPMLYVPQIAASTFLPDTLQWVKVSGTFVASSAHQYITIGNFYDDNNTVTMTNPGGNSAPGNYGAYYFIDDVSVSPASGINDVEDESILAAYPNPVSDETTLSFKKHLLNPSVLLLNCLGEKVKEIRNISGSTIILDRDNLPGGMYFLVLAENGRVLATKKLLIGN